MRISFFLRAVVSTAAGLGLTLAAMADEPRDPPANSDRNAAETLREAWPDRPEWLDMYMAILLPKYIGTAEGTVLFSGTGASYRQNAGLDANSDGKITKGEATARVAAMLQRGLEPAHAAVYVWP